MVYEALGPVSLKQGEVKGHLSKLFWCGGLLFLLSLCYIAPWNGKLPSVSYGLGPGRAALRDFKSAVPDPRLLVDTPGCVIWDMDPFAKDVQPFLKKVKDYVCDAPIIKIEGNKLVYNGNKSGDCCYRRIERVAETLEKYTKKADLRINTSTTCLNIPKDGGVEFADEFVRTECRVTKLLSSQLVVDYLARPLKPGAQSPRTKQIEKYWQNLPQKNQKPLPPNILIIGIDSTSRLNMMRNLPLTRKYLLANDFVELKGYTKIGDNTFPNVMGFSCGYKPPNGGHSYPCWKSRTENFDRCPFIWKKFNESNYITALLEDSPEFSIFNYQKTGFVLPPVHYYLRPFSLAYNSNELRKFKGCVSGGTETDLMLKYVEEFRAAMGGRVPYFLLSWFTSVGHNDLNNLKNYDVKFEKLFRSAADENTIVFFISDHGYRYGGFRETFLGYYEESLPFFFVRLPPGMKQRFPDWQRHLEDNSKKLLSPLDLHATFEDVLRRAVMGEEDASETDEYFSFFEEVPSNRTCESAGIPNMYCRCGVSSSVSPKSNSTKVVADFLVSEVNKVLGPSIEKGLCERLKFKKAVYFRTITEEAKVTDYLIAIETEPVKARFEARVKVFNGKNVTMKVVGDVGRINSYKGQDACMEDYRLKNFCACSDFVNKKKPKA